MDNRYQRKGSRSNTQVGKDFEELVRKYFDSVGVHLAKDFSVQIGINGTKPHKFDLGSFEDKILVECKSHTWTEGGNVPSAKITTWDQAMYIFLASPREFRKIFFVLKDWNPKKQETLANYYIRVKSHLIPSDIEIWEMDTITDQSERIY